MNKPTFEEWMKSQVCKKCSTPLDLSFKNFIKGNVRKVHDLNGEKVRGSYCGDCGEMAQAELMNERFVENYNGNTIFCKDGRYIPYWDCHYYFKTIEECRMRIDAKHIMITPFGMVDINEVLG